MDLVRELEAAMCGRLKFFSERDDGIADAWNKAIGRSTGDWILFLGADDVLATPDALSLAANHLDRATPKYRVVYGRVEMVGADGQFAGYADRPWSPKDFRGCKANLPHQAVFHHRSLFMDHGPFDTEFAIVSDFEFLMRELMLAEPLHVPGLTVAKMRVGGLSTNRRYAPRVMREEIRIYRRHRGGIPFVLIWWLFKTWAIAGLYYLGGDRLALPITNIYRRLVGGRAPLQY